MDAEWNELEAIRVEHIVLEAIRLEWVGLSQTDWNRLDWVGLVRLEWSADGPVPAAVRPPSPAKRVRTRDGVLLIQCSRGCCGGFEPCLRDVLSWWLRAMYLVRRHLEEIMLAGEDRIKMSYGRFIIIMIVIVVVATVLMIFPPSLRG